MVKSLILVGLGGMLGSMSRYWLSVYSTKMVVSSFPIGTFSVNFLGCLLIGIFYGLSKRFDWFTDDFQLLLTTGFCGGFTTFSAFAIENMSLIQSAQYSTFLLYTLISIVVCLGSVFVGFSIIKYVTI